MERAAQDPFALLGLPATHALDPAALRAALLRAGRRWHPDLFALAPAAARAEAEERMAELNAAHAALADPRARAEALLALRGAPAASGTDRVSCPAVLMKMLELREEAAEARASNDPRRCAPAARRLREERERCLEALARACAEWEAGGAEPARAGPVHARLAEAAYVCRTVEDFERPEAVA